MGILDVVHNISPPFEANDLKTSTNIRFDWIGLMRDVSTLCRGPSGDVGENSVQERTDLKLVRQPHKSDKVAK